MPQHKMKVAGYLKFILLSFPGACKKNSIGTESENCIITGHDPKNQVQYVYPIYSCMLDNGCMLSA